MFLSGLTYRDADWEIGPIHFTEQSLIVGPNASGKSTVLRIIRDFVRIVSGRIDIAALEDCEYDLEFSNDIGIVTYSMEISGGKVVKELLSTEGVIRLVRENGRGNVSGEPVNIPDTTLVLKSRRDTEKYPDIEMVLSWVEQFSSFIFSNILSSHSEVSPFTDSQLDVCKMWEKLSHGGRVAVTEWMSSLHYRIENIGLADNKLGEKSLYVIERDIEKTVSMGKMSNGMFRVMYLLIYLHYVAEHSSGVVIIDDIGEGLDYYRSSSLGKKLFSFGKKHGIQMIFTSNDRFLVDTVDLSSWILLNRTGHCVKAISEQTNPEAFAKFRRLGLSNFDLLKTDYLVKYFD
jgi:ABC-type Mn2+/Zn2+ transport system ATPase subunit